ncbi:hypothetical protein BC831DRAFT_452736, partial [Entophlyctis helioformis]
MATAMHRYPKTHAFPYCIAGRWTRHWQLNAICRDKQARREGAGKMRVRRSPAHQTRSAVHPQPSHSHASG